MSRKSTHSIADPVQSQGGSRLKVSVLETREKSETNVLEMSLRNKGILFLEGISENHMATVESAIVLVAPDCFIRWKNLRHMLLR